MPAPASGPRAAAVVTGRYLIFHHGVECGEERWRIEPVPGGVVMRGEQETAPPHPIPSRHAYRVTLTPAWRITGLEVLWTVGARTLRAIHAVDGAMWRVRIEYGDRAREQEGDFPDTCEVDFPTHLFSTPILTRRDFATGGEHEFPVLRIGPPLMAVTPDRMRIRCEERGVIASPRGPVPAGRYVAALSGGAGADTYAFWADESGIVLESYEGLDRTRPWMRLVEYAIEPA